MTRNELLRKWVEALESGKYRQGRSGLRADDQYCCLGVVCDLSGMGRWEPSATPRLLAYATARDRRGGYLPNDVREFLALQGEVTLAEANDVGESFVQIAQRIRAMYPDVFAEQVA